MADQQQRNLDLRRGSGAARAMRRIAAPAAAVAVAAVIALGIVLGVGSGGGSGYRVTALFDNASFAVPGEQVRIAGATVGTITGLAVTKQKLAAVTMTITTPGFQPWYQNATCAIRPQSLIAERYIDCAPGTSSHPALARISSGPGTGTVLLPVTRTSSPVDPDLVQNISQDSVRQSLSLILDELGTGLAARGSDLNAVIRRANPALGQTDRVFKLLASQNKVLAKLATDSNQVLKPLAGARKQLANFVVQADRTATASAARAPQLEQSIKLLPSFLGQLKPLMADLDRLARQGTPVMSSLNQSATAINSQFKNIVPFAKQAKTALVNLGNAAQQSQSYLDQSVTLANELRSLGNAAAPSSQSLDQLTSSLSQTGALQQLMLVLFYGAGATNGYNPDGHYVRADALFGSCTAYNPRSAPVSGCSANFPAGSAAASAASPSSSSLVSGAASTAGATGATQQPAASSSGALASTAAGASSAGSASAATTAEINRIAAQAVRQAGSGGGSSTLLANLLSYLLGKASR